MRLVSSGFGDNDYLPKRYTCDDGDVNPSLEILDTPAGTNGFALIINDPDAPAGTADPGWVHWLLYNIPASVSQIEENSVPPGAVQGKNDWGRNDYGGPCPPSGTHHYVFTLYALATDLNLEAGLTKQQLLDRLRNHVLDSTQLVGLYSHN